MLKRIEVSIKGRVQLVMFRDFAKRRADRFGISGTVENKDDGSVFVIAEGEEEILKKYLEELKKGPLFAKVTSIDSAWSDSSGEYSGFRILFYGSIK